MLCVQLNRLVLHVRLSRTFFVFKLDVLVSWILLCLQVARLGEVLIASAWWVVSGILQRSLGCTCILLIYWSLGNLPDFVWVGLIDRWVSLLEDHVVPLVALVPWWYGCWHWREHIWLYCRKVICISHAHVQLEMLNCWADFQSLIDPSTVICTVSCSHCLVLGTLASSLVHVIVLRGIISPRIRPLLALSPVLQSSDDLHGVVMMLGRLVYFAIGITKFGGKQITLSWTHLRVMTLHLDLLVNARWNLTRWGITLDLIDSMVWRLLIVDWTAIVRSGCLWEQVVLVAWSLEVLSVDALLCSWDLYLDVGLALGTPISNSGWFAVLLARIEKVLLRSIELVNRGGSAY